MSAPDDSHMPITILPAAMDNNHGSQPAVELGWMPQQIEVRCAEDDWTGRNSAAERRKLQNRLNQRLYRRRRGAKPKVVQPKADAGPTTFMAPQQAQLSGKFKGLLAAVGPVDKIQVEEGDSGPASSGITDPPGATGQKKWVAGRGSRCLGRAHVEVVMARFEDLARRDYMLGSPRVDQLLTLIQFNVFRALIRNTLTMGWTLEWLECSDPISPWNGLPHDNEPSCPPALRPTHVQRTIQHHPWIDLWPIPKMRDNLLLAGDSYDEDQLCNDLVEFEDITNEQTGLIVWGEPWDPSGWEVSETFLRNWGWTVKGCIELLQSTNYWRAKRGENPLACELYGLDIRAR